MGARSWQFRRTGLTNDAASAATREALLHLLLLETSCFHYWGQGAWTAYATEIHRRGEAVIG